MRSGGSVSAVVCLALAAQLAGAAPRVIPGNRLPSFTPRAGQPICARALLQVLENNELASRLLLNGRVVGPIRPVLRRRRAEPATLFRLHLKLDGREPLEVFFKPRQRGYRDWATETAVCQLATHLGARVPPCAGRTVERRALAGALAKVPAAYRDRLEWRGDRLFGFVRVWAPGYAAFLGPYPTTRVNLLTLGSMLAARNRNRVRADPLLRDLPDLFVLDYLVYNNDRKWNVGTLRTGERAHRLFPIDFGDGLCSRPRRKAFVSRLLHRMALFRRPLIEAARRLDRRTLERLFSHPAAGRLVDRRHLGHVMAQRRRLLSYVRWVVARHGKGAVFE